MNDIPTDQRYRPEDRVMQGVIPYLCLAGKSGAAADRDRLKITFGDILVAEKGWRNPKYREEDGANYMLGEDLVIAVDLGMGRAKRSVWTCDLTNRYVEINADYRS